MSKRAKGARRKRSSSVSRDRDARLVLREALWRLDRLERQVKTLSELVRYHAEDTDRLVKIVAEDHEALRQELLHEHQERLRRRKRVRLLAGREP